MVGLAQADQGLPLSNIEVERLTGAKPLSREGNSFERSTGGMLRGYRTLKLLGVKVVRPGRRTCTTD